MKKLLFLSLLVISGFAISAQTLQFRTTNGKAVPYGRYQTTTTEDSALNTLDSMVIADNSAGLIEVSVVAADTSGNGVTGKQIYRYHKSAGTLTLSSATNISAIVTDTGLGTATYTFTKVDDNLVLKVKGKHTVPVKWKALIVPMNITNSP